MRPFVTSIVCALAALGLSAIALCAAPLTASDVQGSWELVSIDSRPVQSAAPNAVPMFTIKDQSIEGFDGCNTFSGRLDKPESIVSTRRGCADGALKLPLDLRDPMSHLAAGRIQDGTLTLPARDGRAESVFKRVERKPELD